MPLCHQRLEPESESIDFFFFFFLKIHKPNCQLLYIRLGPWKQFYTKAEYGFSSLQFGDSILS